jgi:L-aspartate oxidase
MGGIVADLHARSTVPGLYAVGESSCTGLHGANRLASNSLSECFVFARRAVLHALSEEQPSPTTHASPAELKALQELPSPANAIAETRAALWRDAGIARCAEGLTRLLDDPNPLARLLAQSALARTESRGAHQRSDYPERNKSLDRRHFVVSGEGEGEGEGAFQTWA